MKLRRFRCWIADEWPARVSVLLLFLGFLIPYGRFWWRTLVFAHEPWTSWWGAVQFVFHLGIALLLSVIIGGPVAAVITVCTLWPFLKMIARLNGAPFRQGDEVVVLTRAYRDQTARVMAVSGRTSVLLELRNGKPPPAQLELSTWQIARPGNHT